MRVSLDAGAFKPERAHPTDAGMDIRSPIDITVKAHGSAVIPTGVHVEVRNAAGMLMPKSGLNMKHDILSFGIVDEGYSGEVVVKLYNLGDTDYEVHRGDKVTQMLIAEVRYECVEVVDRVDSGERGVNGFGSTGK